MDRTARNGISALSSHICMIDRTSYHFAPNRKYALVYLGNKDNISVISNDVKGLQTIFLHNSQTVSWQSAITVEETVPSGSVNGVCCCSKDT
jgi:hypothetical protein